MRLFAYGVLNRELAKGRAAQLIAPLDEGRAATVRGTLYGLRGPDGGWYPILLPDADGGTVHGMLHDASGVDWPAMDDFEDAHDGPGAEYARRELTVALDDGTATSGFAYCYVRDLPGDAEPIPGGHFGAWLRETNRRAILGRD
ncbi:gamma-glutamylcyclotransferase family protein [Citromicrobium bathyomarinum]|uniref:gamma-glutamylcyclotransferase family protein n=1 Tax=Citromicrobium bathyomarinum TaxID=72174 RepID=UPI001E2964EA|nr:gamma-glutamylcyclotransferase family protein [Citromicrobium bathyomarinum]MCD1622671.1 gamma-glutamylcyclotransferase [Citromicrobium bathyomarinum]